MSSFFPSRARATPPRDVAGLITSMERFLKEKTRSGIGPLRVVYLKVIDPRATGERLEALDDLDQVTLEDTSAWRAIVPFLSDGELKDPGLLVDSRVQEIEARSDASQDHIESLVRTWRAMQVLWPARSARG